MGKFRDQMEMEMRIRGFSKSTQKAYLNRMKDFVKYFMKSPDELGDADIIQYQAYLINERKVKYSIFNQSVSAIKFFYSNVINKGCEIKKIQYSKSARKLPQVLSQEEVISVINILKNVKPCILFSFTSFSNKNLDNLTLFKKNLLSLYKRP